MGGGEWEVEERGMGVGGDSEEEELNSSPPWCGDSSSSQCSWPASGCGKTGSWSSRSPAGTETLRCCPSPRDPRHHRREED